MTEQEALERLGEWATEHIPPQDACLRKLAYRWFGAGGLFDAVNTYTRRLGRQPALIVCLPEQADGVTEYNGIPVRALERKGGWPNAGWYLWPAD